MVVWDWNGYITDADENIYQDINSNDKILQELANNGNKQFKSLKTKEVLLKMNLSTLLLNLKRSLI